MVQQNLKLTLYRAPFDITSITLIHTLDYIHGTDSIDDDGNQMVLILNLMMMVVPVFND